MNRRVGKILKTLPQPEHSTMNEDASPNTNQTGLHHEGNTTKSAASA